MNTKNTTMQAPAATLTEKELWALFVGHTMKRTLSMGPTIEQYKPDDLLRDPGSYGDTEDLGNELANELLESDTPERDLDSWLGELKQYVANLEMISADFARLKVSLATMTDDDDRYQVPTIHGAKST